ncbi:alpha/beta fold hydrolase [Allokutzneria albata]|uniref:Pimeloyl-ACP methyl ester carboxylesterase n=1 Tax=Allokutzneria albata TaxID=211114 RepID=A0A1G9Z8V7_ALLAB|nr:alpha/beta hydrolase [Allokutzneria albata]SDN16823.1 Pimeloyl-ACP methyl ester carboxylesterase [Allokutzneria albata]
MRLSELSGAGGTSLAVTEAGPPDAPPVVLLHGWAQSAKCWAAQLTDERLTSQFRLIAADLRGHGGSAIPAEGYDRSATWAGDVAALLAYAGRPAVLVGWSYGGLVIADYLREHGSEAVAGIALVGAITELGRGREGGRTGAVMRAALPAAVSDDPAVAVPALRGFVEGIAAQPLPGELAQRALGTALSTPPAVRLGLFRRDIGSADVLAGLTVPALVIHGLDDQIVDPAAGRYAADLIPGAATSWYPECGHLPFVEHAERFTTELAEFVGRCQGAVS